MRPGVVYTFSVTWSGLSSQPHCLGTRTRVGAGSYALVGRLGSLVSPRSPLTLRRPVLDVPLQDRRLGQPGQALPDDAGPGLADALDRLQVVHGGREQPLQAAEVLDQPVDDRRRAAAAPWPAAGSRAG